MLRRCELITSWWIGIGAFMLSLLISPDGRAELYVGGQVGAAIPLSFQSVEGTGRAAGTDGSPIQLNTSFLYGGKVGYFFRPFWIGSVSKRT